MAPTPIRRALVSVSDKRELALLAQTLVEHRVEVLSTGGTFRALGELGVPAVQVSEYTGAPEILDGRVKTLHPRIHGGILALPTAAHEQELRAHGIPAIDLVVVNLYPFAATIRRPDATFAEAIENIDVGGPSMIRAAAKNWERVAVVVDPDDYRRLAEALAGSGGVVPEPLRRALARKAFAHTAAYDATIAEYLAGFDDRGEPRPVAEVPETVARVGHAVGELRYGENPHQAARMLTWERGGDEPTGFDRARLLQGKAPSYNNLLDADAALGLVRELVGTPAACVVKHGTPCGAAIAQAGETLAEVYVRARDADGESAFGGIVALSTAVDEATAARLSETFLEVVVAPEFSKAALSLLGNKTALRLLQMPVPAWSSPGVLRLRSIAGAILVQREDAVARAVAEAEVVTRRRPSPAEIESLELAQKVAKHMRSNAIALVRDRVTVGLGAGQTSRVESVRQAAARAGDRARGAVLASDAFFPFRDGIDLAAAAGVTAIVQPGGSKRDAEVIAAADERGLAMVFTGERHFRH